MRTPVAFIIFNRPDTTARVFAEIARARPSKLLLIADGPRESQVGEAEKCTAARAIAESINWPCDVLTNYSDSNMGCRSRVSSGLNWLFEQVEEAIILEDDCLPHPSFFPFCDELLERYRDDERVMTISGNNFQLGRRHTPFSYYFSLYPDIWGWASWRRAWRYYDVEMNLWPALRKSSWLSQLLGDEAAAKYWQAAFDRTYAGHDTWDYQWTFSSWAQNALAVLPEENLVTNIGWGVAATHTDVGNSPMGNLPVSEMLFPLKHPPYMVRQSEADQFEFDRMRLWYGFEPTLYRRLHRKIFEVLPAPVYKSFSYLRAKLS